MNLLDPADVVPAKWCNSLLVQDSPNIKLGKPNEKQKVSMWKKERLKNTVLYYSSRTY